MHDSAALNLTVMRTFVPSLTHIHPLLCAEAPPPLAPVAEAVPQDIDDELAEVNRLLMGTKSEIKVCLSTELMLSNSHRRPGGKLASPFSGTLTSVLLLNS